MIRRPPRSTLSSSSAASDVYKRQVAASCRWRAGSPGSAPVSQRGMPRGSPYSERGPAFWAGPRGSVIRIPGAWWRRCAVSLLAEDVLVEPPHADLLVGAVGDHVFEGSIDGLQELGIALLNGDTHLVGLEDVTHGIDLEAGLIAGHEADELIGDDGVETSARQVLEGDDVTVVGGDVALVSERLGQLEVR